MKKILVVGTGAREHAICKALMKDDIELYSVMSNRNPGIAEIASKYLIGKEGDLRLVTGFAKENGIDIAFIGPEAPLGEGIVDALEEVGVGCVGPTQAAARIETNKQFMRDLFVKYNIPGSLDYEVFDNYEDIDSFLSEYPKDVVVKPIGLTGGKGVKIVGDHLKDNDEAKEYARHIMETEFGGHPMVIIEEKAIGEEFTIQAFSDGEHLLPMPAAQDHPHAFEGDVGPITGGMGSYSDTNGLLPFMTQEDYDAAVSIMEQTIKAIAAETDPYKGVLYGQFMLGPEGPKLIEYNARFGDPEAMNVLPLLKTSLVEICEGVINTTLDKVDFEANASVCKYLVPDGYPETKYSDCELVVDNSAIEDLGAEVFYAAVNLADDNKIYTSSSRALGVVGTGSSLKEAEEIAEKACSFVSGELYHRRDVGTEAIIQKRLDNMNSIR